jgi:protein SCO1
MKLRLSWLLIGIVTVGAALAGAWLARSLQHPVPQLASGTWLDVPRELGTLTLADDSGTPFTFARLRGAPTLVFFGFTHCPDVCPLTLYKLTQLQRSRVLPHLRVAFVTVDPQRDPPQMLHKYLHGFSDSPDLMGLTGTADEIAAAAKSFNVIYSRVALPGGDYTMDHSAVVFLLDARARIVAVFNPPFDSEALAKDLRRAAPALAS